MRPLPITASPSPSVSHATLVTETRTLELGPLSGNRRSGPTGIQRAYPWLLLTSTLLAGAFCTLYLTKPVFITGAPASATPKAAPVPSPAAPAPGNALAQEHDALLPDSGALPGDAAAPRATDPHAAAPARSANPAAAFEETNLKVQHVLGARGPAGEDLGRIVMEVPVLYRSRALEWTPQEVARARDLMARLNAYQEKSRALREEGKTLLTSWNQLIGASIPAPALRADSPSLPTNQESARTSAPTGDLDSSRAIEIR